MKGAGEPRHCRLRPGTWSGQQRAPLPHPGSSAPGPSAPPPHHPLSPSRGLAGRRCSRCWPGAPPSRRRACDSDPDGCRTAQPPCAASPASLCSGGRPPTHTPHRLSVPGLLNPGSALRGDPFNTRPSLPRSPWLCPPPSSPCTAHSTR